MGKNTAESFRISTDQAELDVGLIHDFLAKQAYWSRDIPREIVERSLAASLCFGGYLAGQQVAFARVVSDRATFAWLADVFVLPEHRGNGFSKAMMQAVMAHPELQGLRRFILGTSDAHGLYAPFGFAVPETPGGLMEIRVNNIYSKALAS